MTQQGICAAELLHRLGDPACYEDMIQTLSRGQAEIVEATALGVLIRHRRAGLYMLAGDETSMLAMAGRIPQDAHDVLIHGAMRPEKVHALRQRFGRAYAHPFIAYAYYGECPPEEENVVIRPLGMDALDFVHANYGHADRAYLAERLADGVMIGAYVDGRLAGFIGEHIEGSMGLLHIMPEARRHHLGFALERANIRRTMLRGQTPFCQVAPDNTASRSLQQRLGMTQAEGMLFWITDDAF
ncbi:MAG: GNAT family N-acetyltransferase [Candidatus Ventricola sp.]